MRRRPVPIGAALVVAGLAVALPARAATLTIPGCRATMAGQWTIADDTATSPDGSVVRLQEAPSSRGFIQMTQDAGFRQIGQTAALVVFSRDLPDGGRQYRGITRNSPSCAVDVAVHVPGRAASGEPIARSIVNLPR